MKHITSEEVVDIHTDELVWIHAEDQLYVEFVEYDHHILFQVGKESRMVDAVMFVVVDVQS